MSGGTRGSARFDLNPTSNEVIVSLMMTYIALQVADYGITVLWPQGASPQTDYLPSHALLPNIWQGTLITARAVQGFLPLIRLGWAVIRPPATQP